jgi:hypothetical protein
VDRTFIWILLLKEEAFTFKPVNGDTGISATNVSKLNDNTTVFRYDQVIAYNGYIIFTKCDWIKCISSSRRHRSKRVNWYIKSIH